MCLFLRLLHAELSKPSATPRIKSSSSATPHHNPTGTSQTMPSPSIPKRHHQHHQDQHLPRQRSVAWPFLAAAAAASSSLLFSVEAVAAAASVSSFPPGVRRGARRPLPVPPAAPAQERGQADLHTGVRPSSPYDGANEQQQYQQYQNQQYDHQQQEARREAAREDEDVYEDKRLQLPAVSLLDEYLPLLLEDIQRVDDELDQELEHMFDNLGASLGFPTPQKMVGPPPPSSSRAPPRGGKEMKEKKKQKAAVDEEVSSLREKEPSGRRSVKEEEEKEGEGGVITMKALARQRRRSVRAAGGSSVLQEEDENEEVGVSLTNRKSSSSTSRCRKKEKKAKKDRKRRRLALERKSLSQLSISAGTKKSKKARKNVIFPSSPSPSRRLSSSSSSYRNIHKMKKQQQQQQQRYRHPSLPLTPSRTSGWAMAGASLSGFGWACLAVQEIQNAGLQSHYNYLLNPTQVLLSLTVGPALIFLHGGKQLLYPSSLSSSSPLSPLTNHRAPFFLRALTWSSLLFAAFGLFTLAQTRPSSVIAVALLVLPLVHRTPHTHNPFHAEEDEDEGEEEGWEGGSSLSSRTRSSSSLISTGVISALLTVGLPLSLTEAGLLLRSSPPTSTSGHAWIWKLGFLGLAVGLSQMAVTTFRDAQAQMEVGGEEEEEEEEEEGEEEGEVRLSRAGKQVRLLGALSTMALCVGGMGPGVVIGSLAHLLVLSKLSMGGRVWGRVGRMMAEMQGGVWALVASLVGEAMSLPALEGEEEGRIRRERLEGKMEEDEGMYMEVEEKSVAALVAALKKQQLRQEAAKVKNEDEGARSPLFASSPISSSSTAVSSSSSSSSGPSEAEDEEYLGLPLPPSWNDETEQ